MKPALFCLATLVAAAIMVIGTLYLFSPGKIMGRFGLRLPAVDADTQAWLRLKGVRDIVSGVVVLVVILTGNSHWVGLMLLVYALVPLGDMSVVLASHGSKSKAFSVHGVTCAVMLVVGLLLLRQGAL